MTGRAPDVSVLIVSYNTRDVLGECLASLEAQTTVGHEVVVLDNASSDGSVEMVTDEFPDVTLIESAENLGFARGVNRAARTATGEWLLLLNPDTVVLDAAVDRLVAFARAHPGHGLYGGRTERRDGALEPSSCWNFATLWSTFSWATGFSTAMRGTRWFDPEAIPGYGRDTVREVDIVTGCLLLVDRHLWESLGGFDERYFMYGEDADLAMRVAAVGHRPLVCPDAVIVHDVGGASATRADKMVLLHKGKATLMAQHWSPVRRCVGVALLTAGVGVRAAASWVLARVRGGSSAKGDGWIQLWRSRHDWRGGFDDQPM